MSTKRWWDDKLIEYESEADMMAEVIAERIEASEFDYLMKYGPGRIVDMEHNMEKIYE